MRCYVTYKDRDGRNRKHTLTDAESVEALRNDYTELMRTYDPRYVVIRRMKTRPGEALCLLVMVNAPSHFLTSRSDRNPKACSSMTVTVICYPGYPLRPVSARYNSRCYLASPNVYSSGEACIDKWIPLKSSLLTVVQKLVMDMIHNPDVTRYDSVANLSMCAWHRENVRSGKFPTINPDLLYSRAELSSVPVIPAGRETSGLRGGGTALPPRNKKHNVKQKKEIVPPPLPHRSR